MILWLVLLLISLSPLFLSRVFMCSCSPTVVRFIHGMDFRGHVDNKNLRNLSWLNIPDRVRFFRMSHLFRIRHNLAPKYLLPNFKSLSVVHTHNTRGSSHNFHLSRDLSLSPNGFSFIAIKQWNELPNSLKSIDNFRVFKRRLKQFLLDQYDWFLLIFRTDLFHLWPYDFILRMILSNVMNLIF